MIRRFMLVALLLAGCSDAPSMIQDAPIPTGDDTRDAATLDAGTPSEDAAPKAAAVIDVADTPCRNVEWTTTIATPTHAAGWRALGAIGVRRFAATDDALVTFDESGSVVVGPFAPSNADLVAAGNEGDRVAVASFSKNAIRFSRWDVWGGKLAEWTLQGSSSGANALAVASRTNASLVVWQESAVLRAVEVTKKAGGSYDFGAHTFSGSADVAAASNGETYGVAWSGIESDGRWRARFATFDHLAISTVAFESPTAIHVASVVATPNGWAVLATAGGATPTVLVFFLDASGATSAPVHRYLGADYGTSIASRSSGLAMVAHRASGEPEFRAIDATGAPTSPWVCLSGALPSAGGFGIDSDPSGYAAVFTTDNGNVGFALLDQTGH